MIDSSAVDVNAHVKLLSAVADPVRWQLLAQLAAGSECACNLQPDPPIAQNLLSYHLKVLREAGLIEGTRRGRWIDYHLVPGALDAVRAALPTGAEATRCAALAGAR